jgi:hypothetical protein
MRFLPCQSQNVSQSGDVTGIHTCVGREHFAPLHPPFVLLHPALLVLNHLWYRSSIPNLKIQYSKHTFRPKPFR